jgi:hypothetical protein
MEIKIVGVRRGSQYSPNHIGNDAAIFDLTSEYLKEKGCQVMEYSEEEFLRVDVNADLVFNMARDTRTIKKLQQLEDAGMTVINSGYGIQNCTRERMTRLLLANDIPHPQSFIVDTDKPLPSDFFLNTPAYWVKRGDFHAIHREDVTYTRNEEETESVLNEYALRGIKTAVINEHLEGDLLKFYGVAGADFFHWFYPNDLNHSKFGLEKINGTAKGIPFNIEYLKSVCNRTAAVLNICIYGGDGVVSKDGTLKIIDFNDWPSFAPCRKEAAPYIVKCIYEKVVNLNYELISHL